MLWFYPRLVKSEFEAQNEKVGSIERQLSGGQKAEVSLAFILATQRCDPVPFYFFDEVYAALDPECRAATANMIGEQEGEAFKFNFSISNLTLTFLKPPLTSSWLQTSDPLDLLETAWSNQ